MQIKQSISFKAGLTSQMKREIAGSDVKKISDYLSQQGIPNDFKENKLIAWCSLKCLEIIKKLKLGLPKGIFVEDFKKLNILNKNADGLLNFAPTKLYSTKDLIVGEKTIFFNEHKDLNYTNGNLFWDNIDQIADHNFETKFAATDYFLEIFLHEFAHSIHEENLINKLGGKRLVQLLYQILNEQNIADFQTKYKNSFNRICQYAAANPLDAVACDLSKRIITSLDSMSLIPKYNCIKNSPYRKFALFYTPSDKLEQKLRKYWNGKFFE